MPSSTSLGGLPQCRCHMLSLLSRPRKVTATLVIVIWWYDIDRQDNGILQAQELESGSVQRVYWSRFCISTAAVLSKIPFLFNLIWLLQLWPPKSYTANHGCIRSMRTAADLHPLFRCVLFQIQRTLSLATPFPNWLCYANQIDFSICRMTRRVTWAADRWVYALHLLAKGHAEPCFYVHHLAMIERPW